MFTIRKAVIGHINEIVKFQLNLALETEGITLTEPTVREGVDAVFNDPSKGNYYVVVLNNQLVASLLVTYEWSDWRNGQVIWIQSLYVTPEKRKQGIFKYMYSFLKSEVQKNEVIIGIRLYVDKSNEVAINTYRALGMNGEHYQMFEWIKP